MSNDTSWEAIVVTTIQASFRPDTRFALQTLYQRVKASELYEEHGRIGDVEAVIRNKLNKLVKEGRIERLGQGDYRWTGESI